MNKQKSQIFYRVLKVVSKIPKGSVSTYKEVARAVGISPRAVGAILRKNHTKVPCHRVVMSNGNLGGYNKGIEEKVKKLKEEGVIVKKCNYGYKINFNKL